MEYLLREKLERLVQSEIEARVARMHQVRHVPLTADAGAAIAGSVAVGCLLIKNPSDPHPVPSPSNTFSWGYMSPLVRDDGIYACSYMSVASKGERWFRLYHMIGNKHRREQGGGVIPWESKHSRTQVTQIPINCRNDVTVNVDQLHRRHVRSYLCTVSPSLPVDLSVRIQKLEHPRLVLYARY